MNVMTDSVLGSITDHTVAALPAGTDTVVWDGALRGFGVRVYPTGRQVYIVQTRARGQKAKRVKVADYHIIPQQEARRRAALIIARIESGLEPHPRRPIQTTAPEPVADPVTKRVQRQNHECPCWVGVPSGRADLDAEGERAPERSRSAWVGFCSEESGCRRLDRFSTMSGGIRKRV